jgi:DNA repair protein RecN (Recombination protein N)
MLQELRIENLGVIEKVNLVLAEGLVALTGETGAGKTMIVEAISLLVGSRADSAMIRTGCGEATIEGRFVDGDEEVILTRVVPRDGRSRAYVNGRLATVAQLSEIGSRLVDLHGQHAHQSLLGAAEQRAALDAYGKVDLSGLEAARSRVTELEAALATLGGDERQRAREIDLLGFQVSEIESAEISSADEDELLNQEEDVLANADALRESLWGALSSLIGSARQLHSWTTGIRSAISSHVYERRRANLPTWRPKCARMQMKLKRIRLGWPSFASD